MESISLKQLFTIGFWVTLTGLVVVIGLLAVSRDDVEMQTSSESAGTVSASTASVSIERKLATIDTGRPYQDGDPTVRQYAVALDSLVGKCTDGRIMLANKAVTAQEYLRTRYGKEMSTLEILRWVNESIPPAALARGPLLCDDIYASLIVLIGKR